MMLDEKNNNSTNVCPLPESTWIKLYNAKCADLEITCRSDKQQERFVTQMKLNQKGDRISLKDHGFSYASATIIGKKIIGKNDNLVKIDLSNNQLQQNFRPIVKGIKNSKRLISLTMKNNQLHGPEHALDIKEIIKNHPTLTFIDFSNNDTNINKNKFKNIGAQAIVEGILESDEQGCSLISAINLSYNLLTSDCLR